MAMLRERGTLGRDALVRVLGKERARRVVQTLRQRRLVTWRVELAGAQQTVPRQRYACRSGSPEELEFVAAGGTTHDLMQEAVYLEPAPGRATRDRNTTAERAAAAPACRAGSARA